MNKVILFAILSLSFGLALAACKKDTKKDDCYDNNKTKACEMKCARGEKKACAKWCHFTETEEACGKACALKDQDSCKKLKTLKKESSDKKATEKKDSKHVKILEPYCNNGCKEGSLGKVLSNYGTLTFSKMKAGAGATGKAPTIASCTEKCVEDMLSRCPKEAFAKQYADPCAKLK